MKEFNSVVSWALNCPIDQNGKKISNNIEKLWGNKIINQENNSQWTTKLGESFVFTLLEKLGENPRKPKKMNNYKPDIETDNYIYEVKTRNWTTSGTAGEKVFGTPFKYSEIPLLYNKPLRIICVAFQEYEFKYGNTVVFGEKIREKHKLFLKFYEENNITFMECSKLIQLLDEKELNLDKLIIDN